MTGGCVLANLSGELGQLTSELPSAKLSNRNREKKKKDHIPFPDLLNAISASLPSRDLTCGFSYNSSYPCPGLFLTSATGGQCIASVGERESRGEQSPAGGKTSSGHS